ncbi:hypothetical protein MP638_005786 [Amoeboaphelidium occidentale]|nr:hypothetical protein MP638_005786 [Amoeboaphelidium occidentale]
MTGEELCSFEDDQWYNKSVQYWENIPATVNGMLGGMPELSKADIKASGEFLNKVLTPEECAQSAVCECGAGIGRISKELLSKRFKTVDLVEPVGAFLSQAKEAVPNIGATFQCGLESFQPPLNKYKVVWAQWVLNYLKDDDLLRFVKNCLDAIEKTDGVLIVKENITRNASYCWDEDDTSVTRPESAFLDIFAKAGGMVIAEMLQPNFPQTLFPVKMWAVKRSSSNS